MPIRVAVVGAGVGGLAVAGLLARLGSGAFEVTVHEQAHAWGDVGAGLVMSPNARRVLGALGLGDALLGSAVEMETGFERRRWEDGRVLSAQPMAQARLRYGVGMATVHRADLLALLRTAIPADALITGSRCVAVDPGREGGPVVARFADGAALEADLVVGADGTHSVVRDAVTEPVPARFAGMSALRALVPAADAPAFALRPVHTIWLGPGAHLVHYPVRSGELVNLIGVLDTERWVEESWSTRGSPAELAAGFDGWDPRLRELIDRVETTGRWGVFDRAPLPRWTSGRVALLGDAAHPMLPFLAQGAAQALEDAAVLASCLTREPLDHPADALAGYERRRRERVTGIQQASLDQGAIINMHDGPRQRARDEAYAGTDMVEALAWLHGHDPLAEPSATS